MNCEEEGEVELTCNLPPEEASERISDILSKFMDEHPFHTCATNFISELLLHGIATEEIKYDVDV